MKKLKNGKDAKELVRNLIQMLMPYKKNIRAITTDNGSEFRAHKMIAEGLETTVYFTEPYSSSQKGAVENANGFIKQYIPKSSPIKQLTERDIEIINKK